MPKPLKVTLTIEDEKGHHSFFIFHLEREALQYPDEFPISDFVQDMVQYVDFVILGKVTNASVTIPVELPTGIKVAALDGSDVEEGAQFTYRVVPQGTFEHTLPTFDHDLFPDGGVIDITNQPPELFNLVMMMTAPIELSADWPYAPTDSRGDDIPYFIKAEKVFESSRVSRGRKR